MADKEQKQVNHLYAAFAASIILLFIPLISTQLIGSLLILIALIWAYIIRSKAEHESLAHNHAAYIIRTIWIWGLFLTIGIIIAVPWLYSIADHSAIQNFMNSAATGTIPESDAMNDVLGRFMRDNLSAFIMVCGITIGPSILYIIFRLAKGLSRALKGYRIANARGWF